MPLIGLILGSLISSTKSIDIRTYGAIGDGKTLCTGAFKKSIEAAVQTGIKRVVVPEGNFLTGTIRIPSDIELHLERGALILGSPHHSDYIRGVWPALILSSDATNIAITGEGVIDGQGADVAKDVLHLVQIGKLKIPPKGWRPSEVDRPEVIEFTRCHRIRIEGVKLKNATCWVQTYRNCTDLTIRNEKVDSKTYWNNDGIDVVDCKRVKIQDCDIDSNDDGICLKSVGAKNACEDIEVSRCKVRSSPSAIKFGTSSGGGFRRIHINDIQILNTFRSAIALESVDGGVIEDVLIERIDAWHAGNAFFIRLGHRNLKAKVGKVRRIKIRNMVVSVPSGRPDFGYPFKGPQFLEPHNIEPSSIVGHRDNPITDIAFENIRIIMPGGGKPSVAYVAPDKAYRVPERPTDYPEFTMFGELPAWGLYVRHAQGIRLKNVQFRIAAMDYRPAIVLDDTHGFSGSQIVVKGIDSHPTVVMRHSSQISIPASWNKTRVH